MVSIFFFFNSAEHSRVSFCEASLFLDLYIALGVKLLDYTIAILKCLGNFQSVP